MDFKSKGVSNLSNVHKIFSFDADNYAMIGNEGLDY